MILKDIDTGDLYELTKMDDIVNGQKKYQVVIERSQSSETETLGKLVVYHYGTRVFSCKTLEMPWKDNKRYVSCIPKGTYKVETYTSAQYPGTYKVLDVPDRSAILIHWGNYYFNTEGCILVGEKIVDINGDGELDVTSSRATLDKMKESMNYQDFDLIIK